MTNKDLEKFLNDNSWEFNKKTIEQMLEKELQKEPESINLDFVDSCMNYLTGYSGEKAPEQKGKVIKSKHIKRIRFSKILIAAVIVILSVSVGMTAYAKANDLQIADIFVSIFENKAVIKYSDKELIEQYSNNLNGNMLYNDKTFEIAFENNTKLKIIDYSKENNIQDLEIEGTFISSKKININKIDIYLFECQVANNSETLVSYQIDKTQYLIVIKEDILTAEQFVLKNRI